MNEKDMSVQGTLSGFTVMYSYNDISKVDVNCNIDSFVFSFADGRIVTVNVSEFVEMSKAYNQQFGITLTDDGTRFFVQSWESGLFCFDIATGNLIWHNKQRKAYNLATKGNVALCRYYGKCISIIDIESGQIIQSYPLAIGTTFKPLSQDYYLVGPKRGYYHILDSKLERQARVSVAKLNPNALDTFIIHQASLTDNGIVVEGVEYTGDLFRAAIRAKTSDDFIEKSRFVRQISVCMKQK